MRILVTGSDGFVGRHLVDTLRKRDIQVITADKKTGINLAHDHLPLGLWDSHPDLIIHLAGSCSTLGSINRPMDTFRDTVVTAANVMDLAAVRQTPVIVTSSVKARDGLTPYGAAKQMVETWSLEAGRTYDFPVIVNRPGTIYGPGQEGSLESGWIAWFLKARDRDLTVTINGDGHQVRDLLHVSDYVRLLVTQAMSPSLYASHIWDVGGGEGNEVTVLQMAARLGLDYTFGPERYGDSDHYVGINDVPGWEPTVYWGDEEMFK